MKQRGTFRTLAILTAAALSIGVHAQVKVLPLVFVGGSSVPASLQAEFDKWHQVGTLPRSFAQRFIVEQVEGVEFVRLREDPLLSQLERRSAFFSELARVVSTSQGALLTPETTTVSFQNELSVLLGLSVRGPVVASARLNVSILLDMEGATIFPFTFATDHLQRPSKAWSSTLIKAIQDTPRPATELNQIEGLLSRTTAIMNFGGSPGSRSELVSRVLWRYERLFEASRQAMLESELQAIRSLESAAGLPGLSEIASKVRVRWSDLPEGIRARLTKKLETHSDDSRLALKRASKENPTLQVLVAIDLETGSSAKGVLNPYFNAVQFPIGRL